MTGDGTGRREPTRALGRVSLVRKAAQAPAPEDEALQVELAKASALLQSAQYGAAVEVLEDLIALRGTDPRITGRLAAARALFFQQQSRERQERASAREAARSAPLAWTSAPSVSPARLSRPSHPTANVAPLPPPPSPVPLDEPLHEVETRSEAFAVFGPLPRLVEESPSAPVPPAALADVIPLHPRRQRPSPVPVLAEEPLYIEHFRGDTGSFVDDDERVPTRERSEWPQPAAEQRPFAAEVQALPEAPDAAPARVGRTRAVAFMVAASLCSVLVTGSAVALVAARRVSASRPAPTRVHAEARPGLVLHAAGDRAASDLEAGHRSRTVRASALAAGTGVRLRVLVTPAEAEAVVTFRGVPQPGTQVERAGLPAGSLPETVTVTAPGFTPATVTVTLDRDQELRVQLHRPVKRMKLFPL